MIDNCNNTNHYSDKSLVIAQTFLHKMTTGFVKSLKVESVNQRTNNTMVKKKRQKKSTKKPS